MDLRVLSGASQGLQGAAAGGKGPSPPAPQACAFLAPFTCVADPPGSCRQWGHCPERPEFGESAPAVTLKSVNGGDDAKDIHVKGDLGAGLGPRQPLLRLRLPPDPEQQAAGTEAVGAHGVAVGVLGPEVELQPLGGVSIDLCRGQGRRMKPWPAKWPAGGCTSLSRSLPGMTQVTEKGPGAHVSFRALSSPKAPLQTRASQLLCGRGNGGRGCLFLLLGCQLSWGSARASTATFQGLARVKHSHRAWHKGRAPPNPPSSWAALNYLAFLAKRGQ